MTLGQLVNRKVPMTAKQKVVTIIVSCAYVALMGIAIIIFG